VRIDAGMGDKWKEGREIGLRPEVGVSNGRRLKNLIKSVKDVEELLIMATAHGRALVGRDDENGIGDDVFPARSRRGRIKLNSEDRRVTTSVRATYTVANGQYTLEHHSEEELDGESEILDRSPTIISRKQLMVNECNYLLNHDKKIQEAEERTHEVILDAGDCVSDVSGEAYNDLPVKSKDILVRDFITSARTITVRYHTKPGNQPKRRGGSLTSEDDIHVASSINKPGGLWMRRPERFSMIDFSNSFMYVSLLPPVDRPNGYNPEWEEQQRWAAHRENLRKLEEERAAAELAQLEETKEFLRLRQEKKERDSQIWTAPVWVQTTMLSKKHNYGNGYPNRSEFNFLTRKSHAASYLLTSSPFHALSKKKMTRLVKQSKAFGVLDPILWLTRLYTRFAVHPLDEFDKARQNSPEKFTFPGVIDVNKFVDTLGITTNTLGLEVLGAHVDHRGSLLPFDTFVENCLQFCSFNPIQIATFALYALYDLKHEGTGYMLDNLLMIINNLHGTTGNALTLMEEKREDDAIMNDYTVFLEQYDKAWVGRYVLDKLGASETPTGFIRKVLEYPIILWPIFDLQRRIRRKLFGDKYWKYAPTVAHEIDGFDEGLVKLSKFLYAAKHHTMSELDAWGMTSRTLLVDGALRRHSSALISKSFLRSIFGRSRSRHENIVLIQIWWRLLLEEKKARSNIMALEKMLKLKLEEEQHKVGTTKARKNVSTAIKKIERQLAEAREIAYPTTSMRDRLRVKEAAITKAAKARPILSPEQKGSNVLPPLSVGKATSMDMRTDHIELGACIVPHCHTTINWADKLERVGLCNACRTYSLNFWANKLGYKWGYRLVRRAQLCKNSEEPRIIENNAWLVFRDSLVRENFYFNVGTGEPRWSLAKRHKDCKETLNISKQPSVLIWEQEREEKRKYAAELRRAERQKEELLRGKQAKRR
jgi:hypothetical protein